MLNKYPGKCENWKPDPDPSNGEELEDFYHAFHGDW